MGVVFFFFSMVKAITPRYRYDQLMRLGWKVFCRSRCSGWCSWRLPPNLTGSAVFRALDGRGLTMAGGPYKSARRIDTLAEFGQFDVLTKRLAGCLMTPNDELQKALAASICRTNSASSTQIDYTRISLSGNFEVFFPPQSDAELSA